MEDKYKLLEFRKVYAMGCVVAMFTIGLGALMHMSAYFTFINLIAISLAIGGVGLIGTLSAGMCEMLFNAENKAINSVIDLSVGLMMVSMVLIVVFFLGYVSWYIIWSAITCHTGKAPIAFSLVMFFLLSGLATVAVHDVVELIYDHMGIDYYGN